MSACQLSRSPNSKFSVEIIKAQARNRIHCCLAAWKTKCSVFELKKKQNMF